MEWRPKAAGLLLFALNRPHPQPIPIFLSSASKSFPTVRELSSCVYSLSVKSPWWTQFLRLVLSLKLFAAINYSKIIIIAESCALAFSIFALDRLIIFASLIHSDSRDCRRSTFSDSSTYLLRTLSCLVVAFFAAPHGLFICFTLPIIFFLSSTSNLDARWCFDRIASSPEQ